MKYITLIILLLGCASAFDAAASNATKGAETGLYQEYRTQRSSNRVKRGTALTRGTVTRGRIGDKSVRLTTKRNWQGNIVTRGRIGDESVYIEESPQRP